MINTHNPAMNSKFRPKITFIYLNLRDMNNAKKIFKSLSTSCSATGTKDLSWNPDVPNSIKRSSAGSSSTSFKSINSFYGGVISFKAQDLCVCVHLFCVCFSLLLVLGSCFTQNFVCLAQIKSDSAGEI